MVELYLYLLLYGLRGQFRDLALRTNGQTDGLTEPNSLDTSSSTGFQQTRNDWKQVKQNRPFQLHNTENRNIITSYFFEPLYMEDIT